MTRPLKQHDVGQLEELFAKGKAEPKVLKQLENELRYRQVCRALALLAEVKAATSGGAVAPGMPSVAAPPAARRPGSAPVPKQPGLWERSAAPPVVAASQVAPVRAATSSTKSPEPSHTSQSACPVQVMPLDVAYKILKASPQATSESIEQTRRMLVEQSHPSLWKTLSAEKRAQALTDARQANVAHATMSHEYCGRGFKCCEP